MLTDKDVMATIAVKDMTVAKKFYGGALGLKPGGVDKPNVVTYRTGNSTLMVYQSQFAGTNKATSATWGVGEEFEAIVQALQKAGVTFAHYDLPELDRKGDIHFVRDFRAAWFEDPDGNILHINSK